MLLWQLCYLIAPVQNIVLGRSSHAQALLDSKLKENAALLKVRPRSLFIVLSASAFAFACWASFELMSGLMFL